MEGSLNTNFIDFFIQDLPLVLLPFIMAFIITKLMKPEKPINGKAYFQQQLKDLGKMTTNDKKVLVILLVLLAVPAEQPLDSLEHALRIPAGPHHLLPARHQGG